jgi:hypothetical protein
MLSYATVKTYACSEQHIFLHAISCIMCSTLCISESLAKDNSMPLSACAQRWKHQSIGLRLALACR